MGLLAQQREPGQRAVVQVSLATACSQSLNVWRLHALNVCGLHALNVWGLHTFNVWGLHTFNVWGLHALLFEFGYWGSAQWG